MSQVLVSAPPIAPLAMIPLMEAVERPNSQQQPQLNAINLAGEASEEERYTASQLVYLASQHHTSEYNRLKFGPGGAPIMYIPISIQLPAHVRELRARQVQSTHRKSWWPATPPANDRMDVEPVRSHAQQPRNSTPPPQDEVLCTQVVYETEPASDEHSFRLNKPVPPLNHPPTLDLQRELSVAMSSPLSIITIPQLSPQGSFRHFNLTSHAKTSESHPINISPIVPFELLPLISSHLAPMSPSAPYMFELPSPLHLNHLTIHSFLPSSDTTRSYPTMQLPKGGFSSFPNGHIHPIPASSSYGTYSQTLTNGTSEPTVLAINESAPTQNEHLQTFTSAFYTLPDGFGSSIEARNAYCAQENCSIGHQASSAPSLRPPSQERSHSAPPLLLGSLSPEALAHGIATMPPPLPDLVHAMSSDILPNQTDGGAEKIATRSDLSPPITWAPNLTPNFAQPPHPMIIGNILLSSCPGKKVRLSGPVKGRAAICRDLEHDFRRVKALGVGCVICCLDDDELEFLGASWSRYSEVARRLGLDVLRIPIPEGLAPSTPALLDQHLSYIIHSYTLKGVPVLVHCRGGVGRAGLVACCWILKLGLCGWLLPPQEEANAVPEYDHGMVKVRPETVELIERVITVVRRRRSVKAIETYEQVRFLVEFVEHLKAGGNRIGR